MERGLKSLVGGGGSSFIFFTLSPNGPVRVVVVGATAGISGGVFASFFASPSTTAASVDVKLFVGGSNTVSGGGAAVVSGGGVSSSFSVTAAASPSPSPTAGGGGGGGVKNVSACLIILCNNSRNIFSFDIMNNYIYPRI